MNNPALALHLFLQVSVILLACRLAGAVAAKVGQPQVVAEMITGILLGPSLLGLFFPEWQQWLFPWDPTMKTRDTQSYLFPLSQFGLALYMFIVGLEFRADIVGRYLKSSIAVSVAGMVMPFVFGAGLAWVFFQYTDFFPKKNLWEGVLFLGASISITAFPVLARLIEHKKLGNTAMGAISLGAGAVNDVAAWGILAVILAGVDGVKNIGAGLLFVAVAVLVVRPLLSKSQQWLVKEGSLTESGLVSIIILMSVAAWFTEKISLHAVFGAFVIGVVMPRGIIVRDAVARLQPVTVGLLLPLFFTYSGLNTKMGLLNSGFLWLMCGAVLVASIVGKGVACWLAARATGVSNREALGIGTLMNVRGLMELIIINIGLQRGIISEGLFAILVIMAVATTVMACPIFDLLTGKSPPETVHEPAAADPAEA